MKATSIRDRSISNRNIRDKNIININIVLIGLPGSGKTNIGRAVAKRLSLPFYDVDDYIEKKEGKTIKEIFLQGEDYFRELESKAIEELSKNCPSVISTGGGAVKIPSNMEVLKKNSIIVFLNRPLENILKNIDTSNRPLLADGKSKLHELYKERYHLYKKYCDIEIINNAGFNEVVERIIRAFRSKK
jgi:shikimate kinase